MLELCTQPLETQEMGVQTAAAYLVATGLGNDSLTRTGQQRANHQYRAAKLRAFPDELIALQVAEVKIRSLEDVGSTFSPDCHPNIP